MEPRYQLLAIGIESDKKNPSTKSNTETTCVCLIMWGRPEIPDTLESVDDSTFSKTGETGAPLFLLLDTVQLRNYIKIKTMMFTLTEVSEKCVKCTVISDP